jgi:two-component system sensor histidine kinase HydH
MFDDPVTRSSAIALHPFPNVAGGFAQTDGTLIGYVFPARAGTPAATQLSPAARAAIDHVVADARAQQDLVVHRVPGSDGLMIVAASPVSVSDAASSGVAATVAIDTLSSLSAATDPVNLLAAVGLISSVVLVIGFAIATLRDLQTGVRTIEYGLDDRTARDEAMALPPTPELARISAAINIVAERSRTRREREHTLERELRHQEHLAALGRVVAAVAHEVRNPLASMKLKVQMAERAGYPADRFEPTAQVITEEIDRLDGLVRRLLELGRTPGVHRSPVDLCTLLRDRLALMRERFERQRIHVTTECPSQGVRIAADADRLTQVIDNVLQNALEAMPAGGLLTVVCDSASETGAARRVTLSFNDTGVGVPSEDQGLVFEPFYTRRDGGTGLGLAIAREVVEAHGGRISLTGASGQGAQVSIELPVGEASA